MESYLQQQLKKEFIYMLRRISLALLLGVFTLKNLSGHGQNLLGKQNNPIEIWGEATNGLQPHIIVLIDKADVRFDIEFRAQTNFSRYDWLIITNRVGSKPRLWLTNRMELQSTNPSILAAMNLPSQTTVSNIMWSIPSRWRGGQWLRTNPTGVESGEIAPSSNFSLQSAFGVLFTNDFVLQITPLLYRVETNEVTAHLVEFPPIKVKLMANGDIRKEE